MTPGSIRLQPGPPVHKYLVREGRLSKEIGDAYNTLMETRQEADYTEQTDWTPAKAQVALDKATQVVAALRNLLPANI